MTKSVLSVSHASEGGHWYSRTGEPVYQVPRSDGKGMRDTTLRDAKKLGLLPSVTGIISCADKPGLTRWKLDQMLHAALTLPRFQDEPEGDWIKRVWQDSTETARKAAERGTAIHAAIQGFYDGETSSGYEAHIDGAAKAVSAWSPESEEWKAERSFAMQIGYGGKVDLSAFDQDTGFILDFKTKEFGPDDDLRTWDEHAMQLAAYREGLGYPNARCAIVYVSVTVPGLSRLIEIPEAELQRGWRCFYSLLQFWKAKNNFDPSFERKLAA